jgi:hypothetical protein
MSAGNVFDLAKLYALRAGDARLFDLACKAEQLAMFNMSLAPAAPSGNHLDQQADPKWSAQVMDTRGTGDCPAKSG